MGGSFAAVPYDVLNMTSGLGSDELDLTSLLSTTSSYSVTDAPVFNWGGDPSNPGFGCDTSSVGENSSFALVYSDALTASDWGLVRNYEMSMDMSSYWDAGASIISVSNFQTTNIQLTAAMPGGGATNVIASNVQSGTFDLSHSYAANLDIATASVASGGMTQTYVVLAGHVSSDFYGEHLAGDSVTVSRGTQITNYAGNTLTTNGSTSLLDFYDNGGDNTINLTGSQISSNLFMGAGSSQSTSGGGSMNFLASGTRAGVEAQVYAAGGDLIQLNASGSGAAHIYTDLATGFQDIEGFQLGRDSLDMFLPRGSSTTSSYSVASLDDSTVVSGTAGPTTSNGVIFTGIAASTISAHESSATVGGVTYLNIS
jgi:hypothetical protein